MILLLCAAAESLPIVAAWLAARAAFKSERETRKLLAASARSLASRSVSEPAGNDHDEQQFFPTTLSKRATKALRVSRLHQLSAGNCLRSASVQLEKLVIEVKV